MQKLHIIITFLLGDGFIFNTQETGQMPINPKLGNEFIIYSEDGVKLLKYVNYLTFVR